MALRATCPRVPGPNNEGLATKCHGPSHSCRVLNVTRAPLYQPTDGQLNHQRSSEVEAEHNDTDVFYFLHHLSFLFIYQDIMKALLGSSLAMGIIAEGIQSI